jgi:hypothetical protein
MTTTSLLVKLEDPSMRLYAHFVELIWVEEVRDLVVLLYRAVQEVVTGWRSPRRW